jgi:hypothetical protein
MKPHMTRTIVLLPTEHLVLEHHTERMVVLSETSYLLSGRRKLGLADLLEMRHPRSSHRTERTPVLRRMTHLLSGRQMTGPLAMRYSVLLKIGIRLEPIYIHPS